MKTENNKIIAEFIGWKEQEEDFIRFINVPNYN